jgi:carbon-monoxide dehydrogenase medium subunit
MFLKRLPKFAYHTPSSLAEAIDLASRYGSNARFIAGGTDLLVAMKERETTPEHLVSLNGIDGLKGITADAAGGIKIGALTTLADIQRSAIVKKQFLSLWEAVEVMSSPQIRSLATIGGNLCSAVPSADTAPPLMALSASLKIVGPKGERTVPVEGFFTGPKQTVCKTDEILAEILIPKPKPSSAGCYLKLMRRRAMDLALVGVAAYLELEGKTKVCKGVRIALGAVAPTPITVPEGEAVLMNKPVDEALIAQAARAAGMQCRPITDLRASLEYRCSMVEVLTRRALAEAYKRISA